LDAHACCGRVPSMAGAEECARRVCAAYERIGGGSGRGSVSARHREYGEWTVVSGIALSGGADDLDLDVVAIGAGVQSFVR
jgi:hypothetical protein